VVCGHIHQPEIKQIQTEKGSVKYLNSGDWVENLTSLEYHKGQWKLYSYEKDILLKSFDMDVNDPVDILEKNELFQSIMNEFKEMNSPQIEHKL
tara:strand:- start:953 stop:1234 length:282 start_codon:yes stop_codon:yes gene_type:complete